MDPDLKTQNHVYYLHGKKFGKRKIGLVNVFSLNKGTTGKNYGTNPSRSNQSKTL